MYVQVVSKFMDCKLIFSQVYLAVACLGAGVAVLFFFATLPEITEADMAVTQEANGIVDDRPLYKRVRPSTKSSFSGFKIS